LGLIAEAYQRLLLALLPPGRLWRLIGEESFIGQIFLGTADELARLDARAGDLLNESVPSTAVELLPEYEDELGIETAATLAERQARVTSRYVARQRFRPIDFQNALAPLLGQAAGAVVVMERTTADALSMADVREVFRFFIYRDPTLPGTYYLEAAQELVDKIKPSHTKGHVIESISMLCDDPFSLCDRDLLGA
jgi:hypothetical protein